MINSTEKLRVKKSIFLLLDTRIMPLTRSPIHPFQDKYNDFYRSENIFHHTTHLKSLTQFDYKLTKLIRLIEHPQLTLAHRDHTSIPILTLKSIHLTNRYTHYVYPIKIVRAFHFIAHSDTHDSSIYIYTF